MFAEFALATGVAGFLAASYTDLKKHEVSEKLVYSMIVIGLFLHLFESIAVNNPSIIYRAVLVTASCFVFSFALFKTGVWATGDIFMFTALGATIPYFGSVGFFPFFSLTMALLCVFPFVLLYTILAVLKDKNLRKEFVEKFHKKEIIISAAVLSVFAFLENTVTEALIIFASILFFSVFITSFKIAKSRVFAEWKKTSQLKEGDIPVKTIVMRRGKPVFVKPNPIARYKNVLVNALNSDGLTEEQIKKLGELGIKKIEVKKTIPFVPIFTTGIIITLLLQMLLNA